MSLSTSSFLACVASAMASSVGSKCGQVYPAGFLRHGNTVQRTLSYGAPTAQFTATEPFLAGCAPSAGYVSTGQKIVQVDMTYTEGSTPEFPLLESAVSNDTDVGSFYIVYESTESGSILPLRPRNMTVVLSADGGDAGRNFAHFVYDSRGRLVRANWTHTGPALRTAAPRAQSPLQRLQGSLPMSPTEGYETFDYEDETNPDFVTLYRSNGVPDATDGPVAIKYHWTTNSHGLVTDTTTVDYEPAECKAVPCKPDATTPLVACCREIGSSDTTDGTCYTVENCDELGGETWHYEYSEDDRTLSMNASGTLQEYTYDDAHRLTAFNQGNDTIFTAAYDTDGAIHFMTYFVIYPIFPELWGFDAPVEKQATLVV